MEELNNLIATLPHRPPMRLITAVRELSPTSAVCFVRIDESLCRLFGDGASVDAYIGIEALAQTAAIALGRDEALRQRQGVLAQVSRFVAKIPSLPLGAEARLEVAIDLGLGGTYAIVAGRMLWEGREVCSAKLSIAVGATEGLEKT